MKRILVIVVYMVAISSCKQKNLIPNLVIGMEEQVWKDTIKSMLKRGELNVKDMTDSFTYSYKFKTSDSLLNTEITINGDGVGNGKLRVISLDFADTIGIIKPNPNSTDPNYPTPSEDSALYENSSWEDIFMSRNNLGRISYISGSVFSVKAYENLYNFLKKNFGNPDSILDLKHHRIDTIDFANHKVKGANKNGISGGFDLDLIGATEDDRKRIDSIIANTIDTSNLSYFFHSSNSVIVLERNRFIGPNYFIPFIHTSKAILYQFSNSYDKEFDQEKIAQLKGMRPSDLIAFPLYYDIEKKTTEYGRILTYLMVRANLDPNLRKTLAETREIESMKGRILISDKYGTLIQQIPDIEIQANGSLPAKGQPGRDYAIGMGRGIRYNMYRYGLGIYVGHKDISYALKQAVEMKNALSIEFIPDAIMFTDGSVLK